MSSSGVHRILYAVIADSRKITHEAGDTNRFNVVVSNVLERCTLDCRKSFRYQSTNTTLNYISEYDRIWLCVADGQLNTRVAFAYLEYIKQRSPIGADKAVVLSLMTSQLNTFTSSADRISQINAEIESIREVMIENINAVLRRGERIEDLNVRAEELREDATLFKKNSSKLKNHFRWANLRWYLIGFAVLLVVVVGITWGICGLRFQHCRKSGGSPKPSPSPAPSHVPSDVPSAVPA